MSFKTILIRILYTVAITFAVGVLYLAAIIYGDEWKINDYVENKNSLREFAEEDLNFSTRLFNMDDQDVFVHLHVQKTGGSIFEYRLLNYLPNMPCFGHNGKLPASDSPGDMVRMDCLNSRNQTWIFSRKSTKWGCGVHADLSTLRNCVDNYLDIEEGHRVRKYHYVTMLRDPVSRYVSEWMHVTRGADWSHAALTCNYNGSGHFLDKSAECKWSAYNNSLINIDKFISCPFHMANNRQTWMLADVTQLGCERLRLLPEKTRESLLLESAKKNLLSLSFFGLTEFYEETQYLFEKTFSLELSRPSEFRETVPKPQAHSRRGDILQKNRADQKLYEFGKSVFFYRLHKAGYKDRTYSNTSR